MRKKLSRLLAVLLLASIILCGEAVAPRCEAVNYLSDANRTTAVASKPERVGSRFLELLIGDGAVTPTASERVYLIPGGEIFGTRIKETHLTVAVPDEGGVLSAGDKIISINGREIANLDDIKAVVGESGGNTLSLRCLRGGRYVNLKLNPKAVGDEWRLGAVLREGAAGIGTVTYINPKTMEFGGLGHGICDSESGRVLEVTGGKVTGVILGGVVKGESGKPGELSGILTDKNEGEIYSNTECGVFGKLNHMPSEGDEALPCAHRSEVHRGEAKIISTLKNGKTLEYKVEIYDINRASTGTKSFKIKVCDEALIAISGGIVRGMSGSPIIQDGRLVGAVTHVLVDDPCSGYGIFIENMLAASNAAVQPKAA